MIEAEQRGLKLPNLRRFVVEGAYATGVEGVLPTVTYPSHTTLLTGASPAKHGVVSNTTFDPAQINAGRVVLVCQRHQAADALGVGREKRGYKVRQVSTGRSASAPKGSDWNLPQIWRSGHADDAKLLTALSTPGLVAQLEADAGKPYAAGIDESITGDENRGDFAVKLIETLQARLHRPSTSTALDHEQHAEGPGTAKAHAVLRADRCDRRTAGGRRAAPPILTAVIAIASDHGFASADPRDQPVPPRLHRGPG